MASIHRWKCSKKLESIDWLSRETRKAAIFHLKVNSARIGRCALKVISSKRARLGAYVDMGDQRKKTSFCRTDATASLSLRVRRVLNRVRRRVTRVLFLVKYMHLGRLLLMDASVRLYGRVFPLQFVFEITSKIMKCSSLSR